MIKYSRYRYLGITALSGLLTLTAMTRAWTDDTATLLPNAIQYFMDANGKPLANGKVFMYTPSTTTPKTTWTTADKSVAQPQPFIPLGIAGKPSSPIYGDGSYRQLVKDQFNNTIWDFNTASTGGGGSTPTPGVGDGNIVGTILPWSGLAVPPNYVFAYGQAISRTGFPLFFNTITLPITVTCVATQPVLSGISDTSQIKIGSPVEASCIPPGATVLSKTANSVTMSSNASITTSVTGTFFPFGNGDGSTTFNVPDLQGFVVIGRNNMSGTASSHLDTVGFNGTNPNALGASGGSSGTILSLPNLPPFTPAGTITNGAITSIFTGSASQQALGPGGGSEGFTTGSLGHSIPAGTVASTQAGSTFVGTLGGGTSTRFTNTPAGITMNYIIKVLPDASGSSVSGVASIGGMTGVLACGTGLVCGGNTISVNIPALPLTPAQGGTGVSAQTFNFVTASPYSAVCDGSGADTSAAFQAAINATPTGSTGGTTYIDVPPNADCSFGIVLDFKGHPNLKLRGYGGEGVGNTTPSIMRWTGAGGARAMDFRDSNFNGIDNLALYNVSHTFTGILVDAGATVPLSTISSGFSLTNTTIGSTVTDASPTCLNISEAQLAVVENNNFSRCAPAIHGQNLLGQNTVTKVRNNVFQAHTGPAILECGEAWTLDNNTFEADVTGNANSFRNTNTLPCRNITFAGNWFGDITGAVGSTGTQVTLTTTGLSFTGNALQANVNASLLKLDGGSGFTVLGNYLNTALVGITCVNSPTGGRVNGNSLNGVTTAIAVAANCINFDWANNSPDITPAGTGYVTLDTTQTITGAKTFGSAGGVSKLNIAGNTSGSTALNASAVASGVLTLPAATDTLLARATTDTLTNKSISGSTNTLTNIANASLTNPATTVNGQTCTLGASCTVTAAATGITVGTTTVSSGTSHGVLTNNAGNLGNTAAGTNGQLFLGVTGAEPAWGTMSGDATITNAGALTLASTITAGGPTGSATVAPIITYDAKGRLTAVSSATITPSIGNVTGLGAGVGTWVATPSSANLAAAVTDETGSGALVFGTSPTLGTPIINGLATGTGVATANTASTLVARDGSGNFAAGTITAALSGNATTATSATSATTATNATNTAITDDTTTAATMFPTWVTANTGNLPQKTTSTKLTFNPSTGVLSSTVLSAATHTAPGAMTFQSNGSTFAGSISTGQLWYLGGTSLTPAAGSTLTVSQNTGGTPGTSALGNILGQFIAADTTLGILALDTFGAQSAFAPRRADGTQASKTALAGGATIFGFGPQGWDGSAYGSGASLDFLSTASVWSGSNHGAFMRLRTATDGATALTERFRVQQGMSIGDTTDPGVGGLRATGATIQFTALASDAATTDNTVCISSAGTLLKGSGTLGICLGTSSKKFKHDIVSMGAGLAEIVQLSPKNFFYNKGYGDDGKRQQYGFIAEEVVKVLPGVTGADSKGITQSVDMLAMVPVLVNAIKQLKADNDNLRMDVLVLQAKVGTAGTRK